MLIYSIGLITLLLCFCGLALDLGSFELTRIRMQDAADAAALGAVVASQSGGSMAIAGSQDAAQNGFTSGAGNVTVTITNPPSSGTYAGNTEAAQATIVKKVAGIFIPTKFTLTAQATALGTPPACVYLLSQYSSQPSLTGINQTISATCPFYLGRSYSFNGGSGSSGSQFYVAASSSASTGTVTPGPMFGAPVQADPLANVAAPALGGCDAVNQSITTPQTLYPGTYCGTTTINTTGAITLEPGTYVILGSLTILNGNISGAGITIYLSQGDGYTAAASTISNLNATLSAPTTGPLQGLLIFADRTLPPGAATLTMKSFNPNTTMDGIIYLPGQELTGSATFQGKNYFGVVADLIVINNSNFKPSNDYSSLAGGNPLKSGATAGLVD